MGIGKRIKEARNALNMTQEDLAKRLGITKGAVANYENETSHPKEPIMYKMFDALRVDANYLFQDVTNIPQKKNDVTLSEYNHIKKYRALDDHGRETIDIILNREAERVKTVISQANALAAKDARIAELEAAHKRTAMEQAAAIIDYERATSSLYLYAYMGKIACAGTGFYFDDIPTDTMEVPYMEGANFIVGVNGDSMEPDYYDGDKLYIKKTEELIYGEVGIFTVNNECFLKEYGNEGLISRNPKYNDIPGTEDVRLIGRVLGKVDEKLTLRLPNQQ